MRATSMLLWVTLLAAPLLGCDASEASPLPAAGVAPATQPAPRADVDARDQYAFVQALIAAQQADPESDPNAHARFTRDWKGRRYSWELAYLAPLCQRAESCVMAPFDHARQPTRIMQGWLPRLALDEDSHAALVASCRDTSRCIVRIEGTLSTLMASPELPTSLAFSDVRITSTRPARADESWVVSRQRAARDQ